MSPMTIAIASYQRRGPLLRLLSGLDAQLAGSAELRRDLSVIVVLDGSDDGSREGVEAGSWQVPVRVHWQPNRGLAAARNVGLEAAGDGLVWFLDDDLLPSAGLVARHRGAHGTGPGHIVVGPCRIPTDAGAPARLVRWWDAFYEAQGETIERFDRFTTANASGPAALFRAVGGYDESFVTYGLEDYELAIRLLAAGTSLRFDPAAVAWHPDVPPQSVLVARERDLGRNATHLARLHPATVDRLFPEGPVSPPRRFLRRLRLRRPASLMAVSRLAYGLHRVAGPVHATTARRAEYLARAAAHAAGVAEGDPAGTLLDRVLGYPTGTGAERSRARASRQPPTSPTSSDTTISR